MRRILCDVLITVGVVLTLAGFIGGLLIEPGYSVFDLFDGRGLFARTPTGSDVMMLCGIVLLNLPRFFDDKWWRIKS